ncbi:alpha/beta fold hydrolase [Pelistega ratti]|uniref:alpha/beta fold hydrolase n=1 Tax=Pelistega ratti TaxID=2652177 RepID=UPI00135AC45B|nr:alpha/beta hydrolase [Pelistega ratti]
MKTDFSLNEILINDTPYAYIDEGKGPTLLLIHGSLCDYRYWKAQIPQIAQHFRVIAPSLRHYAPITLDSKEGFSVAQHAEDMSELLKQLVGTETVHVLGHSRGGAVALQLALKHDYQVESLLLADPGIRNEEELSASIAFKQEALRLIQDGQIDAGLTLFIDSVSGKGTYQRMVKWFKDMVRENAHTLSLQRFEPPFLICEDLRILQNFRITLIGGSDSPAPFPNIIKCLQDMWPQAKTHILSPASHGMNLSLPSEFNQIVIDHLQYCEEQKRLELGR